MSVTGRLAQICVCTGPTWFSRVSVVIYGATLWKNEAIKGIIAARVSCSEDVKEERSVFVLKAPLCLHQAETSSLLHPAALCTGY